MFTFNVQEWQALDLAEKNSQLKTALKENRCIVTFTKVDGETRVMPCTLMESLLPENTATVIETIAKPVKLETLRVWCTDIEAWRSFRIDNVTDVEILDDRQRDWIVELTEDPESASLILPLPADLLDYKGWKEGDTLNWEYDSDLEVVILSKNE